MCNSQPTSRRTFVQNVAMAAGAVSLSPFASLAGAAEPTDRDPNAILEQLVAGNQRFVEGKTKVPPRTPEEFARHAQGQAPPAIILGCADSRVPPEIVFDQPIGGLFVLRVAGNIVGSGPILLGSVEFAVAELGASVVVVMGHSSCGACRAAIDHIDNNDALPGAIEGMVDYIRPVVREVKGKPGDKLVNVTKANALYNAKKLAKTGEILPGFVESGKVKMVGAYYDLASGKVEFLG
ncbi:carbonic anhydrase [Bremerella sp. JC817]|uniref:carbonic anhydrase n=1 Tax=Bremerella sp. JC817 TaxID=3231756 RepID=UPI003459E5E0